MRLAWSTEQVPGLGRAIQRNPVSSVKHSPKSLLEKKLRLHELSIMLCNVDIYLQKVHPYILVRSQP